MMGEFVFIGIIISVFLLIWTKFNISEHKSICARWEDLITKEEEREDTFKKIKTVEVAMNDGRTERFKNVLYYSWDNDRGFLGLYNVEDKAVAIYKLTEIIGVHFIREGEATE